MEGYMSLIPLKSANDEIETENSFAELPVVPPPLEIDLSDYSSILMHIVLDSITLSITTQEWRGKTPLSGFYTSALRVATVSRRSCGLGGATCSRRFAPKEQAIRLNCSVCSESVYAKLLAARPMG